MVVLVALVTRAATPSISTVAPDWKPSPTTWMKSLPMVGPALGATDLTVTPVNVTGGATGVGADGVGESPHPTLIPARIRRPTPTTREREPCNMTSSPARRDLTEIAQKRARSVHRSVRKLAIG